MNCVILCLLFTMQQVYQWVVYSYHTLRKCVLWSIPILLIRPMPSLWLRRWGVFWTCTIWIIWQMMITTSVGTMMVIISTTRRARIESITTRRAIGTQPLSPLFPLVVWQGYLWLPWEDAWYESPCPCPQQSPWVLFLCWKFPCDLFWEELLWALWGICLELTCLWWAPPVFLSKSWNWSSNHTSWRLYNPEGCNVEVVRWVVTETQANP